MGRGYPDWKTWESETTGGEYIDNMVEFRDIGAGAENLVIAATGSFAIIELSISALDDTAIHEVRIENTNAADSIFKGTFVTKGIFLLHNFKVTDDTDIYVKNNAGAVVAFKINFWVLH